MNPRIKQAPRMSNDGYVDVTEEIIEEQVAEEEELERFRASDEIIKSLFDVRIFM